jgi:hypothetical protein
VTQCFEQDFSRNWRLCFEKDESLLVMDWMIGDAFYVGEALLAECFPIIAPRSPLDALFKDLPVWLVDTSEEVTDEAVLRNEQELKGKEYKWEKLFDWVAGTQRFIRDCV